MRKASKASIAFLLPILTMLAAGCGSPQVNNSEIIGGADGPTSIYLAQDAGSDAESVIGQATDSSADATPVHYELTSELNMDKLRNLYPEFFNASAASAAEAPASAASAAKTPAKGVEVYVWQMSESTFFCGLMYGTNRNKTEEEIWALQEKALTVEEAKAILNECNVPKNEIFVIPVNQPYSSYAYEIDDEYRERAAKLFE